MNGIWTLPNPRSEEQLALITHLTIVSLNDLDDSYIWQHEDLELASYSMSMIYNLIKDHKPQVPWLKVVWTQRGIPKHNFFSWPVVLNRCPAKNRLLKWGLQTDLRCVLLWEIMAAKAGCTSVRQWPVCLSAMQSLSLPRHQKLFSLLAWQSTIYLLWNERNSRIHRQLFRPSSSISSSAISLIKNKISSFRDSNRRLSTLMMQHWL
ncbi:uncharacterized protein LOC108808283 [Raphanus sativus]|uniref:Uncharacterized protein LOC108808283 n=1 Tax=Raphanus sativus TaxID=3726 RepID=A0A6J0JK00_RAPSA|nr:uncharacterized protein LOC108808283 [Raphanus sativus]